MAADQDPRSSTARSIREPGATARDPREPGRDPRGLTLEPRELRLVPPAGRPQRPGAPAPARARRPRPNANPVRLMIGFAGLASAAAFTTAMLPSVAPAPVADQGPQPVAVASADPTAAPSVRHVTQVVQLQPGQTAPPQSTVVVTPTPTPKVTVKVVVKTRQSGKP